MLRGSEVAAAARKRTICAVMRAYPIPSPLLSRSTGERMYVADASMSEAGVRLSPGVTARECAAHEACNNSFSIDSNAGVLECATGSCRG